MNKYQVLEEQFNGMVEQVCWSLLVPDDIENGLTLSIGDKHKRTLPLDAPTLSEEQRHYIAAYELAIADCTWRLDSPDEIVTSWSDEAPVQRAALANLVGQRVAAWEITWPGLDLSLHFMNALSLRLFCDQTDPDDSGTNYALLTPKMLFTVGVRSALTVQARPKA